jgi:cysteine desulfurase
MTPPLYLDWNATAPLHPAVRAAMLEALDLVGNPSSVHGFGRAARRAVEAARAEVAALAGAAPAEVVFTAGGSEANNWALSAWPGRPRLVSAVEHASVLEAAPGATRLPVDGEGLLRLDALEAALAGAGGPALVSLQLANNETGVVQPVAAAAAIVRRHGGLLHVDAVQAAGRLVLDRAALDADLMSLSAHKLGGPKGVGALVIRAGLDLAPLLRGGGQEQRRRAGTENVPGIIGFGAAAAEARALPAAGGGELAALRDGLQRRCLERVPDAVVCGGGAPRLSNTLSLALPGVPAATQLMALDLAGFAVSAGAACSSGKVATSHVLLAMGLAPEIAAAAIRISIGPSTPAAGLERFAEAWAALASRRR